MNSTLSPSHCISWRNFSEYPSQYWFEIGFLSSFNIFVVIGNCFVLLALIIDRHLRTPTHYFIGSLAIADLALGILVLPFATTLHLRGYWTFGAIFCQTWLTFDIWLCTASIYSLIAVTFDRYVAVTKPLTYRLVMTRRKASILIVIVWMAAVIICLPAFTFSLHRTYQVSSVTCQCTQMAHSVPYIAYSSIGSFYLPMVIIVYLYGRIYSTVRKIRLSGSTGIVSMTKTAMANGSTPMTNANAVTKPQHDALIDKGPQLSGTLRVHKGKYQPAKLQGTLRKKTISGQINLSADRFSDTKLADAGGDEKQKMDEKVNEIVVVEEIHVDESEDSIHVETSGMGNLDVRYLTVNSTAPSCQSSASNSPRGSMTEAKLLEDEITAAAAHVSSASGRANPATVAADLWLHIIMPSQLTSMWCQRMAVLQKYQKKFALELKALKTVCIVTGCFFVCWLGFCIVYTMQASPYCRNYFWDIKSNPSFSFSSTIGSCVPDWITSITVWLGYLNSAINPIIYGISNKQFRRTFRRILRCDISFKSKSQNIRRKDTVCSRKRS